MVACNVVVQHDAFWRNLWQRDHEILVNDINSYTKMRSPPVRCSKRALQPFVRAALQGNKRCTLLSLIPAGI